MKIHHHLAILLAAPAAALAQAANTPVNTPANTPPGQFQKEPGGWRNHGKPEHRLPPELRERFSNARQQALQNPTVSGLKEKAEAAEKEFRDAMREAIQKIDPGLTDALKQQKQQDQQGQQGQQDRREEMGKRLQQISPEDRQKLQNARQIAKNTPSVQATAKQLEEAQRAHREAMRQAMLVADPSLQGVLEKMKNHREPNEDAPETH